jgi:outer membrane receptor for ferric coprogen and ferric-rhodotorulic acid
VASVQSVIQLIDPLSVLVGVSYARPDQTVSNFGVPQNYDAHGQVSYRAGLTFEMLPHIDVYASFSESFSPQMYLSINNAVLPPITGKQYEVGLKYRPEGGRLLITGAAFTIDEDNAAQYDQTVNGFDYFKAIGAVRHKGLEAQALGALTPNWQLNASYTYLDPRVVQDSDSTIAGQRELFIPRNTASVFTSYLIQVEALRGLSVGGGARYVSSERTAYDDSTRPLAGYVLVDGALTYSMRAWSVQLNAHNLLNRRYLINNYQTLFYGNSVGDPTNWALTVRRQF